MYLERIAVEADAPGATVLSVVCHLVSEAHHAQVEVSRAHADGRVQSQGDVAATRTQVGNSCERDRTLTCVSVHVYMNVYGSVYILPQMSSVTAANRLGVS